MEFQTKPLYVQVSELLFSKISHGDWHPGSALPNEFQLSTDMKVSIGTVRRAVELLERDGVVSRRQGKGTFVTKPNSLGERLFYDPIRNPDGSSVDWRHISHEVEVRRSTPEEQERFRINSGTSVAKVRRLRSIGTRPAMLCTSFVPLERFPNLSQLEGPETVIVSLARSAGIQLGTTEEVVDICPASDELSQALSIDPRTSILRIQRVVRDIDGIAVQTCVSQCHLECEQYRAPVTRYRDHVVRTENRFPSECELRALTSFE